MTAAPASSAWRNAGTEARMRLSSVILPTSSCGTFRSARMNTRLPRRSRSLIRRIVMASIHIDQGSGTREGTGNKAAPAGLLASVPSERESRPYYFAFTNATVVSSIRLLKPHSLSYQEHTLTRVPSETLVNVESNTDDAGLWLKSTETSGSLLYSSIPLSSADAACITALLTSSTVVARFATKARSTMDTLMVGTRMAQPSSLPFNSGSTRPTAAAAPVLVGIMDMVAERARLRSV